MQGREDEEEERKIKEVISGERQLMNKGEKRRKK